MNIYFDEAGNSGQNLLDPDQPIYILVSHNFTIEEAESILAPIKTDSSEIHFNKLKKYPKYQKGIEEVLNNALINYGRIKIAYYNKKFALCAHLVNLLVETTFYHHDLEYYEGGLNIAFAQSLYFQSHLFESKVEYTELLQRFQKMIRTKDPESIDLFYLKAQEIFENIKNEGEKKFFFPILKSKLYIKEILNSINKFSIDLALPSLTILSDVWYKCENVRLNVIHDDSKQVEFWKDYIMFLSNDITKEKIDVGFDERKMTFPLQIDSIEMVDSKHNIQIQLSDLIGSAFAYFTKNILFKNDGEDKLSKIISNTRLAKINVHPLQPDLTVFEKDFKRGENDINPLDFLAVKSHENKDKFDQSYPI
ncbi:DUF3800 domain-containing protein [Myroides odoratus]|uniref:DUF3800 domain-containing protein n=1 Tax=Myroides odoratus TaxID=256 RepID=UPI003340D565